MLAVGCPGRAGDSATEAQGPGCAGAWVSSLPLLAILQPVSIKITQTFEWKVCIFDVLIFFFFFLGVSHDLFSAYMSRLS